MLGFAQRAGKIVAGNNLVLQAISRPKPKGLVLVADNALTPTGQALIDKCRARGVPVFRVPLEMDALGQAIGKNRRGYVYVDDPGFAARITELLKEVEVLPFE